MGDLLFISKDKKYACIEKYNYNFLDYFFDDLKTLEKQKYKFWFSLGDMAVFKK